MDHLIATCVPTGLRYEAGINNGTAGWKSFSNRFKLIE
jgi:hypothetical protein